MTQPAQAKCLLDLIDAVDNVPYDFDFTALYKLLLPNDNRPHGFILSDTVSKLPWTSDFAIDHTTLTIQVLDSSHGKDTSKAVNAAFQSVIDAAIKLGIQHFPMLNSHSELYRIIGANYFACLERFSASLFGIAHRGAHLTAYVRGRDGRLKIWVARRSANLFTYAGMLDTSVAGGVKADNTPFECIVAEADEEASLPVAFVREHVVSTGVLTYIARSRKTGLISPDALWVYDLELPETMVPVPKDGEVEAFHLWDVERVKEAMMKGEFKPNCNLVMIDFFIRHGIVTQENEEDYLEISSRLRRRLPVPTASEKGAR